MFVIDKKEKLVEIATDFFLKEVRKDKAAKFIIPTGNAPIEMYANICEEYENNKISLSEISTFNLDEYMPDEETNPTKRSLRTYMEEKLFDKTDIKVENTYFPTDIETFNNALDEAGKINVSYLGLGGNGHIGFNEPGSKVLRTNVAILEQSTRDAMAEKYNLSMDIVPTMALTTGLKDILERSEKIIILAWGEGKKEPLKALKKAIKLNQVDPQWPVTNLISHKNLIVLTDQWLD